MPLLDNSVSTRTYADETLDAPGVIEADTATHCRPTPIGEVTRTLTNSIRYDAVKWIVA